MRKSAQLSRTRALIRHSNAFASGEKCKAYHACVVPSRAATCDSLMGFGLSSPVRCSNSHHRRAVAKATGPELDGDSRIKAIDRCRMLEEEARLYESVEQLQGHVLPAFYGRWHTPESTLYVYEYVSVSVSHMRHPNTSHLTDRKVVLQLANKAGLKSLHLSLEEKTSLQRQYESLLQQLHEAELTHGNISSGNLFVYRPESSQQSPESPESCGSESPSGIQARLIDLSEAQLLHGLSAEDRAITADDFEDLARVFAWLDKFELW